MTAQATVQSGARLHVGFRNLSRERDRVFGGIGVAIAAPTVRVRATPADTIECDHGRARRFAVRAAAALGVSGAQVVVEAALPAHVGYGSGTQLALATYTAIARAHGRAPTPRDDAPALGRGNRSGVGVGAFEHGGLIVDAGHPADTAGASVGPADDWTVPDIAIRRTIPGEWRFLLVLPDGHVGQSGAQERVDIRTAMQAATPERAREIERILQEQLVPAIDATDVVGFGDAVTRIDAINGDWFASAQGARYRPPAGDIIDSLRSSEAIYGAGQSSWGPLVYAITTADAIQDAQAAGRAALEGVGHDGTVQVAAGRNTGASVADSDERITPVNGASSGGFIS